MRIDAATIEPGDNLTPEGTPRQPEQPPKGVVKSSWYSNNQLVQPRGRDSNLPIELTSNGLAQECWALWDNATKKWSWE